VTATVTPPTSALSGLALGEKELWMLAAGADGGPLAPDPRSPRVIGVTRSVERASMLAGDI
jgi:hypothetical protein